MARLPGTSKYLNKSFNGWKVIDFHQHGNHISFLLKKRFRQKYIIVRDNEMTHLASKTKNIKDILRGKKLCLKRNVRPEQNTVYDNSTEAFNMLHGYVVSYYL